MSQPGRYPRPVALPAGGVPPQPLRPAAAPPRRGLGLVARLHRWSLRLSFVLAVLLPVAAAWAYLDLRAEDRYGSSIGFAVRSAKSGASLDLLGGLSQLTGASASDAAMVYEYLQSQDLVERLDRRLNLRHRFAAAHERDPVFALRPGASLEDLVRYWRRTIALSYDTGSGLIRLEVRAFSAAQAQAIAAAAFDEAARMINEVSAAAQADATREARADLGRAEARLVTARAALESFRAGSRMLDPAADASGQVGLLNALENRLAAALIEESAMARVTRADDPRLADFARRIAAIRGQIEQERRRFANSGAAGESYAKLMAEYEALATDKEFAERAYTAALAAYDTAQQEARRRALYLAAYAPPSRAETALYPDRPLLVALVAAFALLIWSVLALAVTSLRDRR